MKILKSNPMIINEENFYLLFGNNAVQNLDELIINKSDLDIEININNSPERLFASLLKKLLLLDSSISASFWGVSYDRDKQIKTIVIQLINLVTIINDEIADFDNTVNPSDY